MSTTFLGIVIHFANPLNGENQKLLLGKKINIENYDHLIALIKQKITESNSSSSIEYNFSNVLLEVEDVNSKGSFHRLTNFDELITIKDKAIQIKVSSVEIVCKSRESTPTESSSSTDQSLTIRLSQCANDEFTDYQEDSEDKLIYGDNLSTVENTAQAQRTARWNGRYEPTTLLGAGSFGKVFLCGEYAFNGTHKGTVAVKLISLLGSVEDFNRKIKEALFMLKLKHESIMPCLDLFEIYDRDTTEQSLAIVSPYYIHGDLMKQLQSQKEKKEPLPEEIIFSITKDVLSALTYLHSNLGIAHRDIKPNNIFLEKINLGRKTVKMVLGDFGIAREMTSETMKNATTAGTPLYLAPEVNFGNYNFKCDIYSTGVTLYQMLSLDLETNLVSKCFSNYPLDTLQQSSNATYLSEYTEQMIMRNYPKETKTLKKLKEMMYLMLTYNYKKRPSAKYFLEQLEKKGIKQLFGFKN